MAHTHIHTDRKTKYLFTNSHSKCFSSYLKFCISSVVAMVVILNCKKNLKEVEEGVGEIRDLLDTMVFQFMNDTIS